MIQNYNVSNLYTPQSLRSEHRRCLQLLQGLPQRGFTAAELRRLDDLLL